MQKETIITDIMEWQGITLSVSCERNYATMTGLTHLSVHVLAPSTSKLPITGTGYRSHFLSEVEVEELGGPLGYVRAWLDAEAAAPEWREQQQAARQMALF
ncbi:MAG: hypothetical protein JSR81_10805 [Proteobacteria bacterium]|nr:hypothetical protein [Pseudomonadota bacterium]